MISRKSHDQRARLRIEIGNAGDSNSVVNGAKLVQGFLGQTLDRQPAIDAEIDDARQILASERDPAQRLVDGLLLFRNHKARVGQMEEPSCLAIRRKLAQ